MKRFIVLFVLLTFAASGAFAMEKTAGFSGVFDASFAGGDGWSVNRTSLGIIGFFGLSKYFEANLGFLINTSADGKSNGYSYSATKTNRFLIGLYFKYPFVISDKFVVFPTAGVDFQYWIDNDSSTIHYIWPRAGAGVDYFLNQRMFLRGQFIYGVGIPVTGDSSHINYVHGPQIKIGLGWMF